MLASRWRWTDLAALPLLLRPVRCAYCGQRQFASMVPGIGGLFRVTIGVALLVIFAALFYTRVMGHPLQPLEVLKIGMTKVWGESDIRR